MEKTSTATRRSQHARLGNGGKRLRRKPQSACVRDPNSSDHPGVDDRRPYRIAYEIIRQQIVNRRLPRGLVLLESRAAELLAMSRAPVRRALELLHDEGLVHRFNGRGYLVGSDEGGSGAGIVPLRLDLFDAGFRAPEGLSESIGQFTWERIFQEVANTIGRTIPFGTYRIVESEIARRFNVSRTVVREVLGRLRDRGMIEKNRWSTWIAGPLTARTVDECFDIRVLLEPQALRSADAMRERAAVEALRARLLAAISAGAPARAERDRLEHDINELLFRSAPNQRLLAVIEECQMPMVIHQLFEDFFGPCNHRAILTEHLLVFEHLCLGATDAAAAALVARLEAARKRTKARLKVLAVIPDPDTESYLERIH